MATRRSQLALARMHQAKSFVMLANKYSPTKSISGYWAEEKIDGVRARWTPEGFRSRSGRLYPTPSAILDTMRAHFGDVPLDGELHAGRGNFQRAVSVVRNSHSTATDWKAITYTVFDLVTPDPCAQRRRELGQLVDAQQCPFVQLVPYFGRVETPDDVESALRKALAVNCEGIILRQAAAPYRFGRSNALLKYKRWKTAEAVVRSFQWGEGKHAGSVGALLCSWPDGSDLFGIGSGLSDVDRLRAVDWVGRTVIFRYFELTEDGLPRFPSFVRVK